jgi:cell wall-associated NlpC family hydrolase
MAGLLLAAVACDIPPDQQLGWNEVVNVSHQAGKPYFYGAAGPNSFDCSGLTEYTWALSGRNIPRTAQEQYDSTQHVSQSAALPGDLIFFGAPYSVYHVGVYAGNGYIWDAPTSGQTVTMRQIWDPTYTVGHIS